MTMFELSNSDNNATRLVRADEIDTIESDVDGSLVVYLTSGQLVECDFVSQKEVREEDAVIRRPNISSV